MCSPNASLNGIHARPSRQLLVLVSQLGDLEEGIYAVALQAVQGQAPRPVLGVHPAQRQPHAQPQIGRPARQRRQGVGVVDRLAGVVERDRRAATTPLARRADVRALADL